MLEHMIIVENRRLNHRRGNRVQKRCGGVVVKSNGVEVTSVKNRRAYKRKVDKEKKIIEENTRIERERRG